MLARIRRFTTLTVANDRLVAHLLQRNAYEVVCAFLVRVVRCECCGHVIAEEIVDSLGDIHIDTRDPSYLEDVERDMREAHAQ